MIRKLLLIAAAALMLAGCETDQPTIITTSKYKIVIPPDAMYKCPNVNNLPDPDSLTDAQVAALISRLSQNNAVCRASINQIKVYLNKAKVQFAS